MRRKQTISFVLAVNCLLAGSLIYIFFRPTTLLMFHWADSIGITNAISSMRAWANGFDNHLPNWAIYSLPFALWVLSYLFFIDGIWDGSKAVVRYAWFWCVPIIAIAAECAQSIQIISGRFDSTDLIAIISATIVGFLATDINR